MKRLPLVLVTLLLAGCAVEDLRKDWSWFSAPAFAQSSELSPPPSLTPTVATPAPAKKITADLALRAKVCQIEKAGHKLPIVLDAKLKQEVVIALGESKAATLFRPIARTNYAHRCYCSDTETRAKLGCAN